MQVLCHQLVTYERPVGVDLIKTKIVGIDLIIAKWFWKGDFKSIVNLQIHSD